MTNPSPSDDFTREWEEAVGNEDDGSERTETESEPIKTPKSPPVGPDDDGTVEVFSKSIPIPLTREDQHNAMYLESEFGSRVRYDHVVRHWYIWHKGQHFWREDDHEEVMDMATVAATKRVVAAMSSGSTDALKIAMGMFSLSKKRLALEHLRFHPGIAVGQQHWNQNPDLWTVLNGVLDLRTGAFRPGDPLDGVTKCAPVRYDPSASCPRWEAFLSEVFVTPEMISYVQSIVGYCMTGYTTEQVWFLLYGTGGNGKSVFATILSMLFGLKQYYESAEGSTFVAQRFGSSGSHNVAMLKDARLVVASEVDARATFDGARIKALTGGDPVTAAAKYENNATWVPQLKLMMLVNHLPSTRDDSLGFWRRLRPIPFTETFATPDPQLVDKLRAELPGILNWALSGAVGWYASGLQPEPSSATTLRDEYRAESDPLAMFIHECIIETKNPADTVASREVYRIYTGWCSSTRHSPMNETNFGRSTAMKTLGLGTKKTNTQNVYVGVKVFEAGDHPVKMPESRD